MLEAYERHPDAFTSTASERAALPISWWETRLDGGAQAQDVVLGAFDAHRRLVGVAGLAFESREKARYKATLYGMYVSSRFRHRGLGRSLVLAALDFAKNRGVRIVQLTVTQGNAAAQVLYEHCGFVPFGLEPFAVAVGTQFVSKVHMWRDLESEA
jgi:GNAT superfamily N-acetyltransferase